MSKKIRLELDHPYRVVYSEDPLKLRQGVQDGNGRALGYVQAWHRQNMPENSPYCIANEYVCATLARAIGLPVPPFALTHSGNRQQPLMFSSLDFNFRREVLPPVYPDRIVACLPELATGVVMFDLWIANPDRYDENLAVDNLMRPKRLRVFDHDQALFGGGGSLIGLDRLEAFRDSHGLGWQVSGLASHCILEYIETPRHFYFWCERIAAVPAWMIEEALGAVKTLISSRERRQALEFLLHRQRTLRNIVTRHAGIFSGIESWRHQQHFPY